jgi:hypothetical protein
MSNGNRIGVFALVLLAVAAALVFLPHDASPFETVSFTFQWLSIALLIYAGAKGSRWWFFVPGCLLTLWIWALSRGH